MRLSESLYGVKNYGNNNMKVDDYKLLSGYTNSENSCLPASVHEVKRNDRAEEFQRFSGNEFSKNVDLPLSGCSIYVDPDISAELRTKVFICSLINFFFLFKILVPVLLY